MEEYTCAISRVYAALCALKDSPESSQVAYARDFVVELWSTRDIRRAHKLPRSPFIHALTEMIALRCKQPGAADLDPDLFTEELRAFEALPSEQIEQCLGDNQWWSALPRRIVKRTPLASTRPELDTPPSPRTSILLAGNSTPAGDTPRIPYTPVAEHDLKLDGDEICPHLIGTLKRHAPDDRLDCEVLPPRKVAKLCEGFSDSATSTAELKPVTRDPEDAGRKYPRTLSSALGAVIEILSPDEVMARLNSNPLVPASVSGQRSPNAPTEHACTSSPASRVSSDTLDVVHGTHGKVRTQSANIRHARMIQAAPDFSATDLNYRAEDQPLLIFCPVKTVSSKSSEESRPTISAQFTPLAPSPSSTIPSKRPSAAEGECNIADTREEQGRQRKSHRNGSAAVSDLQKTFLCPIGRCRRQNYHFTLEVLLAHLESAHMSSVKYMVDKSLGDRARRDRRKCVRKGLERAELELEHDTEAVTRYLYAEVFTEGAGRRIL